MVSMDISEDLSRPDEGKQTQQDEDSSRTHLKDVSIILNFNPFTDH